MSQITPVVPTTYEPLVEYEITVNRVFDFQNVRFRPRHTYFLAGSLCAEIVDKIATAVRRS